ncbi:MAG: tetratricopeptide repeat protein [Chloroflexota bacterium]|nr:tetratricopeptide repeat protein [Chloroflexota bacterium]MDE2961563.1 tetratricopeptide repeat protein [Chloroflexota bacterium]
MTLTNHDDDCRKRVQEDPEFAKMWHETAVELLDGNDEDRKIARHMLRDHFGLSEDKIQALQSARADAPRDAAYFFRFGTYKMDACDYAEAIANFDRAITLEPDNPDAYHSRGIAKDGQGDYAGAVADFDHAIALDPDDADIYHNRGVAKAEQGDYAGAIADYDRVIALDPINVAVHDDRAVAQAGLEGRAGAVAGYGVDDELGALEPKEAAV